jgi:tryptophanyl-tRNA synthetase
MSLRDGTAKMSKSSPNPASYISMLDEPDAIRKKLNRAVTDSETEIRFDEDNKPGVSNLLTLQSALSGQSIEQLVNQYQGQGYGALKRGTADAVIAALEPIQQRYHQLLSDGGFEPLLMAGAEKAAAMAAPTLAKVKEVMGLVTF